MKYIFKSLSVILISLVLTSCAKHYKDTLEVYNLSNDTYSSMNQFNYEEINVNDSKSFDLNEKSDLFTFETGKSYFKAFKLPNKSYPYYLKIKSFLLDDGTGKPYVFSPYIITLDEDYRIVRSNVPNLLRYKKAGLVKTLKNEKWLSRSIVDRVLEGEITFEKKLKEKYLIILTTPQQIKEKLYVKEKNFVSLGFIVLPYGKKRDTVPVSPMGYINISLSATAPKHYVIIDRGNKAYTVFMVVPEEHSENIHQKIKDKKNVDIINLASFLKSPQSFIKFNHQSNNIIQYILNYPLNPIGITWNGDIAISRNDYKKAERTYK